MYKKQRVKYIIQIHHQNHLDQVRKESEANKNDNNDRKNKNKIKTVNITCKESGPLEWHSSKLFNLVLDVFFTVCQTSVTTHVKVKERHASSRSETRKTLQPLKLAFKLSMYNYSIMFTTPN